MINLNNKNWRWFQVETWLRATDTIPVIGAEIGVKEGRFLQHMLKAFPELRMYAVDPRENQPGNSEDYADWDWQKIDKEYQENLDGLLGRVLEITGYSIPAARLVDDLSLDFVFLDAQHDYESVGNDIAAWLPKIKVGGLISGHDYNSDPKRNYGVIQAVTEAFETKGHYVHKGNNFTWCVYL